MSNDFKTYMFGLLAAFVIAIVLISAIPAGKDAIKSGADTAGGYVTCKLALCPAPATPAQTSQKNK